MSAECDWCEGAGCEECTGGAANNAGGDASGEVCDWCDGEGCEACQAGDDGEMGGDTAGICDFCEGYGCPSCQQQDDSTSIEVSIANAFYEAESDMKVSPEKSLELFQKVLELAASAEEELQSESKESVFQARVLRTVLLIRLQKMTEMISQYKEVIEKFPSVSQNESNKAVDTILNEMDTGGDELEDIRTLRSQVYAITVEALSNMDGKQKMIFDIQMRQCSEFVEQKSFEDALELLDGLHASCRLHDGSDDQTKGSELLDIYAIEMKIAFETGAATKTKELYERTKNLAAAVSNPKSQSIIKECWGKMFADLGKWQEAYAHFFNAFTSYQVAGQGDRARCCLNYLVVSNMLAGGVQNPFDSPEAAVFQRDTQVQPLVELRKAYEKREVKAFLDAIDAFNNIADDWLKAHMAGLVADFHRQYILKFVKPYRRLRISCLAAALRIDENKTEEYLIQMILDGAILGKMDQVNGLLDLSSGGGGERKYNALESWAGVLSQLVVNLPQPMQSGSLAYASAGDFFD